MSYPTLPFRQYQPYSGRNPRTGDPVQVSGKRLPFFKVGKELKEMVGGGSDGGGGAENIPGAHAPGFR